MESRKSNYTISYSSPFYYLYYEPENKLILQTRFEDEIRTEKSRLEKN